MEKEISITIESYTPIQKDNLIQFLHYKWRSLSYEERKSIFEWRYENNPYLETPFIYLAIDGNGNIVGFRSFVIQKFKINRNHELVCCPADVVVHPNYRGKGLFRRLNEYALNELEKSDIKVILSLSSNKLSSPGNKKLGWRNAGIKLYYYYLSPLVYIGKMLDKNKTKSNTVIPFSDDIKLEITNNLYFEELVKYNENKDYNRITNIRDKQYYEWIYRKPKMNAVFVYCRKGYLLLGYLIYEIRNRNQAYILEYGYNKLDVFKKMIRYSVKHLKIPILRLYAYSMNDDEKNSARKSGFILESMFVNNLLKKKKMPVLVRPTKYKYEESDFYIHGFDIRDENNWKLFYADQH